MARIWHVPYYHIPKHLFTPKGPQFQLNQKVFKGFWGVIKLPKYNIATYIYSPIVTMVNKQVLKRLA